MNEGYTGEVKNFWGRHCTWFHQFLHYFDSESLYKRTNVGFDSFKLTSSRTTRYEALPIDANVTTSYFARQVWTLYFAWES